MESKEKITGAAALWHSLISEGVDTIFGYPGGAIMPAYDALYDFKDQIRHILVRHEQGATHAAEGYARLKGKAGVCIATSGPGATNLVTGIADAMMDSVPLVCITGQVFSSLLGTDAFQETDVIGITMPITKWNYQVTKASEIPEIISKAFFIAQSGRPGPVLVDITKDAQVELAEYIPKRVTSISNFTPRPKCDEGALSRAAALINQAERPLLLVGHGVLIAQAQKEVIALAEKSGIAIASTLHGLSAISTDHPLYVGMLGMHGNYGPNLLTNEADLLIGVGMRFDDRVTGNVKTYATKTKIIHIDIDAAEVNKIIPTTVAIHSDAKDALLKLIPLVEKREHPEWIERFRACAEQEFEKVSKKELYPEQGKIMMAEVIRHLSEQTKGEAVIVADVGQHQMVAARYYRFKRPDSYITSGGLGTMGFALPAAFGAQVADPKRTVVGIIGDGCFQMTIQELGTIAQEKVPVKIVVLNNNFLGMVRQWQELFFDSRYSFVHMQNPDFVKVSEGFGVAAKRVTEREDLSHSIKLMLEAEEPFVLVVDVEKETNVFPMIPAGASVSDVRLE